MQLTFLINLIPELIKKSVIAIDNYDNTIKEYDSIYAASKDLQINAGLIIYPCKNMHKPKKRYTFCYKKSLQEKMHNIYYRGEMDQNFLQNKIVNLDELISKRLKTICQRRAQVKKLKESIIKIVSSKKKAYESFNVDIINNKDPQV